MVLLTPFSQGTHLLSVGRLIVVGDQAYHRCVISKFDDDIRAVCCCTVVCVQGVQEWAEDIKTDTGQFLPFYKTESLLTLRSSKTWMILFFFRSELEKFSITSVAL